VLIPTVLRVAGLDVRPAWVELRPTSTQTLRMPLAWGTRQLNAKTLAPLPGLPRVDEITRLVASMDTTAKTSPLDPFALAERCRTFAQRRTTTLTVRGREIRSRGNGGAVASMRVAGGVDIDRLEHEGLYSGATRNEAAMALARRKMLGLGWSAEDTVEFLMHWTDTMTNGHSATANLLPCPDSEAMLRDEYGRITRGILRGVASGKVAIHNGCRIGGPVTDAEANWVFDQTSSIIDRGELYRIQVFVFCMIGFAKDRGKVAIGPARFRGADLIHVQLPSRLMEQWPCGGSGGYRRWLNWAETAGFTRMVINYRHSKDPALSRARTFELDCEIDGMSGVGVNPNGLLRAAEAAREPGRPTVHPRQVEHALYAQRAYGESLDQVYGYRAGQLVERLLREYKAAITPTLSDDEVLGAA
jgi:hypothetical protein